MTGACSITHEIGLTLALHLNFEIAKKRDRSLLSERVEISGSMFLVSPEISLGKKAFIGFLAIYTKEKYGLKPFCATGDIC